MCRVIVLYADGSFREFFHINKIEFYENSAYKTLKDSELISYRYELGNCIYHLFSDTGAYSVSLNDAKSFEVMLEN